MWYDDDERDTDERCLPLSLGNYSVFLGRGMGRSNFLFL